MMNTDVYVMSVLQYRNTPLADVRLSPAQIIFGQETQSHCLLINISQDRSGTLLREDRERALARRIVADGSKLEEHVKPLQQIPVGRSVAVQNQIGRDNTEWDKTGVVLENLQDNAGRLEIGSL